MKICPKCGREYSDTTNYCSVDGTNLEAVTRRSPKRIEGEPEGLIRSHRDSVIFRIREVTKEGIRHVVEGSYNSDLLFSYIWVEIQKSRNLVRGFVGKKSGKDICEFLEENFTQDDLRPIFEKAEKDLLLTKDDPEKIYLMLRSYIEVKTDEVFVELIRKFREIERS